MANFMDLPKAVREKIYRLHLLDEPQPIPLCYYKQACGRSAFATAYDKKNPRMMPQLLQVSRKIEREASPIYFGENAFMFIEPEDFYHWKRATWLRHRNQMTKIVLVGWGANSTPAANKAFEQLGKLPKLDSLAVKIDEKKELLSLLRFDPIIRCGGRLPIGPHINLQILRLPGMQGFRSLKNVRDLRFIKNELVMDSEDPNDFGSLPGGVLESIRREILGHGSEATK